MFKAGVVYEVACPMDTPPVGTVYQLAKLEAVMVAGWPAQIDTFEALGADGVELTTYVNV